MIILKLQFYPYKHLVLLSVFRPLSPLFYQPLSELRTSQFLSLTLSCGSSTETLDHRPFRTPQSRRILNPDFSLSVSPTHFPLVSLFDFLAPGANRETCVSCKLGDTAFLQRTGTIFNFSVFGFLICNSILFYHILQVLISLILTCTCKL